jgi:YVTN family beta-propeller protein
MLKTLRLVILPLLATAFLHAQTLLVLEKSDKAMAIVDAGTLKVVARVPAGEDPHEIVASTDGRYAFISNYGAFQNPQHTLSVVDLGEKKPLPPVDLGALLAPHGLEFVNGKVYFTAEGSKSIGRYDPATHRIDWVLGLGQNRTHMLQVSKDETRIYTSNVNSDSIGLLDRDPKADASGWAVTTVAVGKGPEGFDVSPDGKELWAANSHDGTISIIDLASRRVTQTFDDHTQAVNRVKFTPDGKLVLLSDLRAGDLVVFDAATRKEVKRIPLGQGCAGILITPDGSRAYVAVSADNNIAVVDLKTLTVTDRIPTGKGPDGMAWIQTR